jgi:hypothetical protein
MVRLFSQRCRRMAGTWPAYKDHGGYMASERMDCEEVRMTRDDIKDILSMAVCVAGVAVMVRLSDLPPSRLPFSVQLFGVVSIAAVALVVLEWLFPRNGA